jgi:hypothetical protein
MLAFRFVQQSNHCAREEFLYELKAGPAGGRLRRPSSAGRLMGRGLQDLAGHQDLRRWRLDTACLAGEPGQQDY